MRSLKIFTFFLLFVFIFTASTGCNSSEPPEKPKEKEKKDEFEPMEIQGILVSGDITEEMYDEIYNTHLILKITRRLVEEPPGSVSTLEILAEIPLFAQRSGDYAGVYGEGLGHGMVKADIGGGAAVSEGNWDLPYYVYGAIDPRPDCGLELVIDETWLEGEMCTTIPIGGTKCEPTPGHENKMAYSGMKFPFIIGLVENELQTFYGEMVTIIEVVATGEQVVNLPYVPGCDWEDLGD